jgi:Tol biopolymer transport system component/DNA-binding winged helix-turn-helix (wHTH) protein
VAAQRKCYTAANGSPEGEIVATPANTNQTWRFGVFEVDAKRVELRRGGIPVKMREQSFRILVYLLEHAGEIVTREELRQILWPSDTFVDFDHSLNTAVMKLREALGDSTGAPLYIETIPKRGYRFVAPLSQAADALNAIADVENVSTQLPHPVSEPSPPEAKQAASENVPTKPLSDGIWKFRRRWPLVATTFVVALATAIWYLSRPLPPPRVTRYTQITNDGRSKVAPVNLYATTVTDGSRLYFGEFSGGHWSLAQASATGGETVIMSAPFNLPQLADISPDRSELLVANFTGSETDAPLWIFSVPAGTPRRLGNLMGHDGTWSPDGKRLAYANGNQLDVARADGSDSHTLVTAPGPPLWIRWSPDGKVLRFTLADRSLDALLLPHASASSLWEISSDGRDFHRLLQGWNNPPAECCGNWTPDGKYYVFQANRNEKIEIWAIREKGFLLRPADREPVRVTAGQIDSRTPVPSADGTKLFVTGVLAQGELSTFDPKSQQLIPFLSGISVKDVSFSADRRWIAYIAYPQGTLWRSKLDGQDRLQLTVAPMQALYPRWSPDGRQIAFHAFVPGKPWQIYTIPAEGGNPVDIAPEGHSEADPDWSPDGSSLVFGSLPWLETSTPQAVLIYILDFTTHRISYLPGSQGLFSPHWSPDGRYIAALSSDSQRIMLFDFKTQKWSELVHIVAAFPTWSHDGQYVYFQHPGSQPSLVRVRIQDHKLEQLINLKIPRVRPWSWFGLTPDDSPILMREVGAQEIYAIDWNTR